MQIALLLTFTGVVIAAAALLFKLVLRPTTAKGDPGRAPSPLLAAEERWRDTSLSVGGARRVVSVRSAFAPSSGGMHLAPWGCVEQAGVLAIVSPLGRDDPRRGVAQATCANDLARTLPRSGKDGAAMVEALASADRSLARLGLPTSTAAATAVAVAIEQGRVRTAHVGADRVYKVRGASVQQLTQDHSIAADTLRETAQGRDSSPEIIDAVPTHLKTSLTRVLGTGKGAAELGEHALDPRDWLVVVSHDVALALGEVRLREVLSRASARPGQIAEELVISTYRQRPGAFAAAAVVGPAQA